MVSRAHPSNFLLLHLVYFSSFFSLLKHKSFVLFEFGFILHKESHPLFLWIIRTNILADYGFFLFPYWHKEFSFQNSLTIAKCEPINSLASSSFILPHSHSKLYQKFPNGMFEGPSAAAISWGGVMAHKFSFSHIAIFPLLGFSSNFPHSLNMPPWSPFYGQFPRWPLATFRAISKGGNPQEKAQKVPDCMGAELAL